MRKSCEACGVDFEAKRTARKYCGERCKKRAQRRPGGVKAHDPVEVPVVMPLPEVPQDGPVAVATRVELELAGRANSAAGNAALALARRIDTGTAETGSSLAAMVREHRATLAEAVRGAVAAADPLDELRARRERKSASG